jgi:hypothetical protein
MNAIEVYNQYGGGYNISKILKKNSYIEGIHRESITGGGGGGGGITNLQIPLGLYYDQFVKSSCTLLNDTIHATVIDDSIFSSLQTTCKNKLRLKTTKKRK